MSDVHTATDALLETWRTSGADRMDVVRFAMIEAMNRRAASYSGEARRILDDKVSTLTDEYARYLETRAKADRNVTGSEADSAPGIFARLAFPHSPAYPRLDVLDHFKGIWAVLSTEKQLRQSLQQVPGNAGPLNSSSLVHKSLSLMHELSPGYLHYFLSYVDALARIEQVKGLSVTGRDTSRSTSAGKKLKTQPRTEPKAKPRQD